ncbi:cytosolic phospholipase A2 zeta-like [Myripristis murdjan]|uniref:cytosolic phospholipase A2 zeta-like n=1 Tax=Myripristis murdjan TaxID=586833 RepID=UPI001175D350|nr:cytosolic phospholipase A2 zeta-like [Myripristis murdjan]
MQCGNGSLAAGLLCICVWMMGPLGQPVGNTENKATPTPEMAATSTNTPKTERKPTTGPKISVRQSQSLCAGEQDFILMRRAAVVESLSRLGVSSTQDSVPHVALLGSGGGQRAAVALLGSLYQMQEEGLLDTVLYLGGVSGSTWSMASLYSDPWWSSNMERAMSRLSGPDVSLDEALAWLGQRAKGEDFSLSDIWGVLTSAGIMKQLDLRRLSEDSDRNATNPYPIYSAVERSCHQAGPTRGKWFELTPHESGFTELGLFVNTSRLGSTHLEPELQMDMVSLQGVMGSTLADEQILVNSMPDWLKGLVGTSFTDENNLMDLILLWTEDFSTSVPVQINSFWDVLDLYSRGYHSLVKLVALIRNYVEDPIAQYELDNLQKTLRENMNPNLFGSFGQKSPERKKQLFEQWSQEILKPIQTWSQSLQEGPFKESVSWLIQKVLPLIGRWDWGKTPNFLYQYPNAMVPSCLRSKEHIHLTDAGIMLNMPFPPFLGDKRDTDLLIALDFSAGDVFETVTLARDYAAKVNKPFPEIDDKVLEDKDWPKDCYVFQGEGKQPTIVYMPLFNRNNCKDAEEVRQRMKEFSTFQLPFNQEKISSLLEIAKDNMKNNKETILREISKAVERRQNKR